MDTKICSKCENEFPATLDYFHKRDNVPDGLTYACKECRNKRQRAWTKNNPEKTKQMSKKSSLKYKYNMTSEDYNEMFDKQKGCCKICRRHQSELNCLVIDHNHETGEIRGLLCRMCNMKIGVIEEYKNNPDKWNNYLKTRQKDINRE